MKRVVLLLTITLCALQSNAQINTAITGLKALNRLWYSCSYDNCLTLAQEAYMHDSTLTIDSLIYAAILGGAAPLQATLNAGNTASDAAGGINTINLNSATNSSIFSPDHILLDDASSFVRLDIYGGSSTTKSYISLYDLPYITGNRSKISTGTLTAQRGVLLPDEGSGTGLASTIVLHTTKDPITVGTSAQNSTISTTSVKVNDPTSGTFGSQITSTGGFGQLKLSSGLGSYAASTLYYAGYAAHLHVLPDEDGTLVTHTTKDPIIITNSPNISTLTDNGIVVDNGAGNVSTMDVTQFNNTYISGGISRVIKMNLGILDYSYTDPGTSTTLVQGLVPNATPVTGTTAAYNSELPLNSGVLLTDFHGTYTTTLTSNTTVIITIPPAGSYAFTGINICALNAATGVILNTAHYLSSIGGGSATLTFASPVSGAFNIAYSLY